MKRKNYYETHKMRILIINALILSSLIFVVRCNSPKESDIAVYSSSQDGDRLTQKEKIRFRSEKNSILPVIHIDEKTHFQMMDGFGATFNEAGMICLNSLDPVVQDSVLRMLFDPGTGAGYTLMKSPIAACDFASAGPWYTYNDTPGDTSMEHFSIERDLGPNGLITFIKNAGRYGKFEIESPMDFAPDWMYYGMHKKEEKNIKPEYYNALADYYLKYLQAYAANGVIINNLVLFNESVCDTCPDHGYSSVTYLEMKEIIKDFIVPRLDANKLSTKIILGETCFRYSGLTLFPVVLDDTETRKYISKLAVHGYDWDKFSSLTDLHDRYPDLPIWMTEICYVKMPVYEFSDGEYWGNVIINDMKNWVSGWIYWNMILDEEGGPWLTSPEHGDPDNNHQHPVVIINRKTKEITYTGLYYYLAHFSRFVKPGACRINCTGESSQFNFVGFQNHDGSIVLNVINNGEEGDCRISWRNKMAVQKLKAHSITTFRWTI
jgi:glucosylceramidase